MKKIITLTLVFVLFATSICFGAVSIKSLDDKNTLDIIKTITNIIKNKKTSYAGPYKVIRVIDGDTFIIKISNKEQRVRLIGVDTPESVSPNESKNCKEGKIASDYTKSRLKNKKVYLKYDVSPVDKYGRILAYVYTKKNSTYTMYQKTLLKKGYARIMTVEPNVKYAKDFYKLQQKARKNKVGFWDGFEQWQ